MKDLDMGLDAIERVLKRVKYEGMKHFGHSCTSQVHPCSFIRIDVDVCAAQKFRQEKHRREELRHMCGMDGIHETFGRDNTIQDRRSLFMNVRLGIQNNTTLELQREREQPIIAKGRKDQMQL